MILLTSAIHLVILGFTVNLALTAVINVKAKAKDVEIETIATEDPPIEEIDGVVFTRCVQNGTIALTFGKTIDTYEVHLLGKVKSSCPKVDEFSQFSGYLNFVDDGPQLGNNNATLRMLETLKQYEVNATFFLNGANYANLDNNETAREIVRRTVAEGHYIGSHVWTHINLINATDEAIVEQMNRMSDKLLDIIGKRPATMRPPYGAYNEHVLDIVNGQLGYKAILWSIDTLDWKFNGNISASMQFYKDALEGTDPANTRGHIVLHHDPINFATELAGTAIEYVRSLGYRTVGLQECLGLEY